MRTLIYFIYLLNLVSGMNWYKNFDKILDNSECAEEAQPIVEYYKIDDYQYMFFSELVSWDEAHTICRIYDGQLAIINTATKANQMASTMVQSNIDMEDIWIGGTRSENGKWSWVNEELIPLEARDGFPPWVRSPNRPWKQCVAMDRYSLDVPLFVDLDCGLPKPFICQRDFDAPANPDVTLPSHTVKAGKSTFILYHSRISWGTAAAFCRMRGYRLAIIPNNKIARIVGKAMMRSRPSFENMWISGHFLHKKWRWLSTGEAMQSYPNENNYPPWFHSSINLTSGCLLIDLHLCDNPVFLGVQCDRKRDFICEKYEKNNKHKDTPDPIKFIYKNWTLTLHLNELNWYDARKYCYAENGYLTEIYDYGMMKAITTVMSDQESEPVHVWLGGKFINTKWMWVESNIPIPITKQEGGVMDWCGVEDINNGDDCLNMDRKAHDKPEVYGLKCKLRQPFVCTKGKIVHNHTTRQTTTIPTTTSPTTTSPTTTSPTTTSPTTTSPTTTSPTTTSPTTTSPTTTTRITTTIPTTTTSTTTTRSTTTTTKAITTPPPQKLIECDQIPFMLEMSKDKVYVSFFTYVPYTEANASCIKAGGYLARLQGREKKIVSNNINASVGHCAQKHFHYLWITTIHLNNCIYLDYSKSKALESLACLSDEKGYMCEIQCKKDNRNHLMFSNNIWNCSMKENAKICTASCEEGYVLESAQTVHCFTTTWVDIYNKITHLPICQAEKKVTLNLINWITQFNRQQYSILFVVNDAVTTEQWRQQLYFVSGLIQVISVSEFLPMGVIFYHRRAKVVIPFNATDTCEVLEVLHALRPDPNAKMSFYAPALELAAKQIQKFQNNTKTLIVFFATAPNRGNTYEDILNTIKEKHKILTIAINEDSNEDLLVLGSTVNETILSYKFNNFQSFANVAYSFTDYRSTELDCPERVYTIPKDVLCHQDSISVYNDGITYTAFFKEKTYESSKIECMDAGGKLAVFTDRKLRGVVSGIMKGAKSCAALELWVHSERAPCAAIRISSQKRISSNILDCSIPFGEICEITCDEETYPKHPKYENNIWNCTKSDGVAKCHVECKDDTVMIGSDDVVCTKNGWVVDANKQITTFPTCFDSNGVQQPLFDVIRDLMIESDGFLFLIDVSGLASSSNWKPLQFVSSVINAFPITAQYPLGLIVFHKEAQVVIPYIATNTCEVLKEIQGLDLQAPSIDDGYSNYGSVLKEAQNQIQTFQHRRRTIIFFLTDRNNRGEAYEEIVSELKRRHIIFGVGISMHSMRDLDSIASMYDDKLLMYKFNNYNSYNDVFEEFQSRNSITEC